MGMAWVFGDNVDTDMIVPGQYLSLTTPEELRTVCMAGYKPGFYQEIGSDDVFIAGTNFGCGSSREHAPISIKAAGVNFIIAKSFARIFYRNAINVGLVALEAPDAAASIQEGDQVSVDLANGRIVNHTQSVSHNFTPFSPTVLEIIVAGGLVEYVRKRGGRN